MPRYLVERTFPNCLTIPMDDVAAKASAGVVEQNATEASPGGTRP